MIVPGIAAMSRMRGVIVHIVGVMNVIVRCAHGGHVCYLCLLPIHYVAQKFQD